VVAKEKAPTRSRQPKKHTTKWWGAGGLVTHLMAQSNFFVSSAPSAPDLVFGIVQMQNHLGRKKSRAPLYIHFRFCRILNHISESSKLKTK
jgi:hypothetical protein